MMITPRQYTDDEIKEIFLQHIWEILYYWENLKEAPAVHDKLTGLAFSILAMLDGCAGMIPAFQVIPMPHPDDKQFAVNNHDNWYPQSLHYPHDIGGRLHELFSHLDPNRSFSPPLPQPAEQSVPGTTLPSVPPGAQC